MSCVPLQGILHLSSIIRKGTMTAEKKAPSESAAPPSRSYSWPWTKGACELSFLPSSAVIEGCSPDSLSALVRSVIPWPFPPGHVSHVTGVHTWPWPLCSNSKEKGIRGEDFLAQCVTGGLVFWRPWFSASLKVGNTEFWNCLELILLWIRL